MNSSALHLAATETVVPMNRRKEIMRSVFAVTLLLALFWFCRSGFFASGNRADGLFGHTGAHRANPDFIPGEFGKVGDGYQEILAMPTCDDLRQSIETLREARNRLLDAAVNQDTQAMQAATAEYRGAVQKVQAGFDTLRMRVAPDDFPYLSQELLATYAMEYGQSLLPCELGSFSRVIYQ
jgi:hypothetical protein